jgi:hypothetical protein
LYTGEKQKIKDQRQNTKKPKKKIKNEKQKTYNAAEACWDNYLD